MSDCEEFFECEEASGVCSMFVRGWKADSGEDIVRNTRLHVIYSAKTTVLSLMVKDLKMNHALTYIKLVLQTDLFLPSAIGETQCADQILPSLSSSFLPSKILQQLLSFVHQ
jgi:hypothetical protein